MIFFAQIDDRQVAAIEEALGLGWESAISL